MICYDTIEDIQSFLTHTHTLSNLYDLCFQISMNQKRKNPTFGSSYNPQDMKGKLAETHTEIIVDLTLPQGSTHGEFMNP